MRRLMLMIAVVLGAIGLPGTVSAQDGRAGGRSRSEPTVPPAYQPPPGMCRIWLDGVPPAQQPASTDCATAVRNRPSNGRVLFGDDASKRGRKRGSDHPGDGGAERGGDRAVEQVAHPFRATGDGCADGAPTCGDADVAGTRALPMMSAATQYARGDRSGEAARWLGAQALTVRVSETGRDGVPTRVLWLNGVGDVVQIWIDRDRDGRADRIEMYRDGRRVQSVGQ